MPKHQSHATREDWLKRYRESLSQTSKGRYAKVAQSFLEWLGDREPSANAVRQWLEKLRKQHYADGTIAWHWAVLRRLFTVNQQPWPFPRGEAPVIRESEVVAIAIGPEVIQAMVEVVLGKRKPKGDLKPLASHRAFLTLSTIWGLRRGEMVSTCPEFLDVKGSLLYVQTEKFGRQRWHIVPPEVMPHLKAWGFEEYLSLFHVSQLFAQLKVMVGYNVREAGWHGIRRSLTRGLFEAGFSEPEIYTFLRWKRSTRNMALRYGSSTVVGFEDRQVVMPSLDERLDRAILDKHPFLGFWR